MKTRKRRWKKKKEINVRETGKPVYLTVNSSEIKYRHIRLCESLVREKGDCRPEI